MSGLPKPSKEKPVLTLDTLLSEISEVQSVSSNSHNMYPPLLTDPKKMRKCPVCGARMELFSVDMERKFLMCDNNNCDFPFGYEPIQIVYDQSQLVDNPPPATDEFWEYPPVPPPLGLKPNTDLEVEPNEGETSVAKPNVLLDKLPKKGQKRTEERTQKKKIQQCEDILVTNQIKEYLQRTEDLNEVTNRRPTQGMTIRNKKWLANLASYGSCNNRKNLLNHDEMRLLTGEEPGQAAEEVVVSIDKMAPIPTIEITKMRKN